jgi:hypothetical protein
MGTIAPKTAKNADVVIYPGVSASETVQNVLVQISYGDAYGNRINIDKLVGVIILPNSQQSLLELTPIGSNSNNISYNENTGTGDSKKIESLDSNNYNNNSNGNAPIINAGKIQKIDFRISNQGKNEIRDIDLTISSNSQSAKILGTSKWTFDSFKPKSGADLFTSVFASEDLIGDPIQFKLTCTYVLNGQTRKETLDMGYYIQGQIALKVYDLDVKEIGNTPNLVGKLLNEGNTGALFTTIELIKVGEQQNTVANNSILSHLPPQQYLGDLAENSPLPFSIPLLIHNGTKPGIYPVELKITYRDNLRQLHDALLKETLDLEPPQQPVSSDQKIFGFNFADDSGKGSGGIGVVITVLLIAVPSVVVIALVIVLIARRRAKSKISKLLSDSDN